MVRRILDFAHFWETLPVAHISTMAWRVAVQEPKKMFSLFSDRSGIQQTTFSRFSRKR